MALFNSSKERRLWLWAFSVLVAIAASLFIGRPLASILSNQNIQAIFFLSCMILIAIAIFIHAWKTKPSKVELSILIGILAVYAMLILRLGIPERSHLIEYSVLAIFIHKALLERFKNQKSKTATISIGIAFLIGVVDESIQLFLPNRVFDVQDILFNGLAVVMAIAVSVLLAWLQKKFSMSKSPK